MKTILEPQIDAAETHRDGPDDNATAREINGENGTDALTSVVPFHPRPEQPDGIAEIHQLRSEGVFRRKDDTSKAGRWRRICSPLIVEARTRDVGGDEWGYLISLRNPDGVVRTTVIRASQLMRDAPEAIKLLLDLGLEIPSGPQGERDVRDYLQACGPSRRVMTTKTLGWVGPPGNAFILGDGRVLGSSEIRFEHGEAPSASREQRSKGSFAGWRDTIAARCVGNDLLMLSVCVAFSGPLLECLGEESGGVHFYGASSRGKTTALRTAISVWGSPKFICSWRATSNGLEGVAAACNSTLLALDEMGEVDAKDAGDVVYMLFNEMGKHRANRRGHARTAARWKTSCLSSGEITLEEKLQEARKSVRAGQEVRLLNLPADQRKYGVFDTLHGEKDGAALSGVIKRLAAEEYGTVGPLLVEAIIRDHDTVVEHTRTFLDNFSAAVRVRAGVGDEGQVIRALRRFALWAVAGELASFYDLTGWPRAAASRAVARQFIAWIEARGGLGSSERRMAIEQVRRYVSENRKLRFERTEAEGEGQAPRQKHAGYVDDDCFYIDRDVWKRDVFEGVSPKTACFHLIDAGYLDKGEGRNLAKKVPKRGNERGYAIKRTILEGDELEERSRPTTANLSELSEKSEFIEKSDGYLPTVSDHLSERSEWNGLLNPTSPTSSDSEALSNTLKNHQNPTIPTIPTANRPPPSSLAAYLQDVVADLAIGLENPPPLAPAKTEAPPDLVWDSEHGFTSRTDEVDYDGE